MAETLKHPKGRKFADRLMNFFDEHPTYTKMYVPSIVTVSLIVQIVSGCN